MHVLNNFLMLVSMRTHIHARLYMQASVVTIFDFELYIIQISGVASFFDIRAKKQSPRTKITNLKKYKYSWTRL
jgi:hypothetical protein